MHRSAWTCCSVQCLQTVSICIQHMTGGDDHLGLPVCLVVCDVICVAVSRRLCLHSRFGIQRSLQQDVLRL